MTRPNDLEPGDDEARALTRRRFLQGAGEVAAGGVLAGGLVGRSTAHAAGAAAGFEDVETLSGEVDIELMVNGAKQKVHVEPRTTLLNALRNHCSPTLTGTKLVCDRGNCGACTVLVDGSQRYACLQLAVDLRGKEIRTVEGLATGEELSPLQDEFCKHDALMCGFCTPGFLMSITAALEKNPSADLAEIKSACAGNVCRCGTYPHIFEAALAAGLRTKGR
ncbi:MAG: (2Fe-2S)-binding protein [Planctomycetes bacterium]|nr:(2Fe-2S)-binding protein [Planctomycetota bacterium]